MIPRWGALLCCSHNYKKNSLFLQTTEQQTYFHCGKKGVKDTELGFLDWLLLYLYFRLEESLHGLHLVLSQHFLSQWRIRGVAWVRNVSFGTYLSFLPVFSFSPQNQSISKSCQTYLQNTSQSTSVPFHHLYTNPSCLHLAQTIATVSLNSHSGSRWSVDLWTPLPSVLYPKSQNELFQVQIWWHHFLP